MKTLIKVLFVGILLFPLTLSAQLTADQGYINLQNQTLRGNNLHSLIFDSNSSIQTGMVFNNKQGTRYGLIWGGGQNGDRFGLLDGDWNWSYRAEKDKYTSFYINNGEKMRITLAGNVGIGTTTPDNKLDVKGVIRAEEVKVELGWSDYVFYDDYQLPTLSEEAAHIEAKGHLLGFESEETMAGEIQLGDVSKRQQAKIEEMMLHLIDMNKALKSVEAKVNDLETENTQLKKQLEERK